MLGFKKMIQNHEHPSHQPAAGSPDSDDKPPASCFLHHCTSDLLPVIHLIPNATFQPSLSGNPTPEEVTPTSFFIARSPASRAKPLCWFARDHFRSLNP